MCGIAGMISLRNAKREPQNIATRVKKMAEILRHRGPDDEGYLLGEWQSGKYHLAFGANTPLNVLQSHYPYAPSQPIAQLARDEQELNISIGLASRRLAILDLSAAGHQPMCNADRTLWIVHNGEIYNYRQLREELKALGHNFISDTDTEVILHSFQEWDIDSFNRFNGMWGLLIWDLKKRRIVCARDRFGVKPFYYYLNEDWLLFASEIKALLVTGVVDAKPSEAAIYDFLVLNQQEQTSGTFFEDIKQLRGGEYLDLHLGGAGFTDHARYWDINEERPALRLSEPEYARRFYEIFEDAVKLRLISDVPVGTCLSGGLDSSSIVCVMDRLLHEGKIKIPGRENIQKTFSARYRDSHHDEGQFIEAAIAKTKIDAHNIYPEEADIADELERLIYYQEEPFGTLSIYAQWNVFKLACEKGVTVMLDGQGSDEQLAGYTPYPFYNLFAQRIANWQWVRLINEIGCYSAVQKGSRREALKWGMIHHVAYANKPLWLASKIESIRSSKMAKSLKGSATRHYEWVDEGFRQQEARARGATPKSQLFRDDIFENYLYYCTVDPGLHHLLHFEDRNSMAFSIEARVPFLDYRLVEFIFSLPPEQKLRNGLTKHVLRQAMAGTLPEPIRQRRDKIGFSTPQDRWFRTLLREPIQDLIESASFRQRPYFNASEIQRLFTDHCNGTKDLSGDLWRALCLELWMRRFIDQSCIGAGAP